jgi:hypothetical protein
MSRALLGVAAAAGGAACCVVCAAAAAAAVEPSISNLIDAAKRGDATALRAQLVQGVEADGADADGTTALMYASVLGHVSCVEVLLQAGAVVDRVDPAGVTALMLSASRGHCQACSALLEAGAQLTVKAAAGPYAGQTALDVAIAAFEPAAAALLVGWAEAHPVDGDIMAPDALAAQADHLFDADTAAQATAAAAAAAAANGSPLTEVVMGAGDEIRRA